MRHEYSFAVEGYPARFIIIGFSKVVCSLGLSVFDLAFLPGKFIRERGRGSEVLKYVFVLLFGLVFGFVLQSAGFLVKAVDSLSRSDVSGVFSGASQGVSYVR